MIVSPDMRSDANGRLADVDFFKETAEDRKYLLQPKPRRDEPTWEVGLYQLLAEYEVSLIEDALREARGNIAKAGRICGVKRTALQSKIKKYGIDVECYKVF